MGNLAWRRCWERLCSSSWTRFVTPLSFVSLYILWGTVAAIRLWKDGVAGTCATHDDDTEDWKDGMEYGLDDTSLTQTRRYFYLFCIQ